MCGLYKYGRAQCSGLCWVDKSARLRLLGRQCCLVLGIFCALLRGKCTVLIFMLFACPVIGFMFSPTFSSWTYSWPWGGEPSHKGPV